MACDYLGGGEDHQEEEINQEQIPRRRRERKGILASIGGFLADVIEVGLDVLSDID